MTTAFEQAVAAQDQAITAKSPLFVRACPGAGKTYVIVSRHLRGPAVTLRRGRALLSFTRAAATQMRRRCHRDGRPDATAFPHYIGTLDAFIWDALVTPNLPSNQPLQLIDSWDRVQAEVKLDRQIPLNGFTFVRDPRTGQEFIRQDLLAQEHTLLINGSNYGWDRWAQEAFTVRNAHYQDGYITGHESRLLALKYLADGESVTGPLRSRFAEIVVDEAQDCSVADLEIMTALHRVGIPLVIVADPDQMIYNWRNAELGVLRALAAELGQTVELAGNWRSSRTVCQAAATLRSGARPPDFAVRPPQLEPPLILLPTRFPRGGTAKHVQSGRPAIDVFLDHAQANGIEAADCLITAHSRTYLPTKNRRPSGNKATMLGHARHVVRSGTADEALVDDACRLAARMLLRYWYPDTPARGSVEARCTAAGVEFTGIIRRAYRFLYGLPELHAGWIADVNAELKNAPQPPGARPSRGTGRLSGKSPTPRAADAATASFRCDNIHQVKGDEHPAVMLLIPDNDTSSRWINGDPDTGESLRGWYVAVTRAQRLITIAVQPEQIEALTEFLTARQVATLIG
ncbi:UvrD-helicase domain-containing protein [Micromonospora sp. NPDC047187]|uniref:UvrD-helicase domain-containing protein n=1 Tax=Micromonospora sp. NPDC047187 TaxID=3155262 RepID=UPI00340FD747